MDYNNKQNEVSRQFAEIFEEHHDPDKKEERIIKLKSKERQEFKKEDLGL